MLTGILSYKIIKNLLSVLEKEWKRWKNLSNKSYRIKATTNIPKAVSPSIGCSSSGFTASSLPKLETKQKTSIAAAKVCLFLFLNHLHVFIFI